MSERDDVLKVYILMGQHGTSSDRDGAMRQRIVGAFATREQCHAMIDRLRQLKLMVMEGHAVPSATRTPIEELCIIDPVFNSERIQSTSWFTHETQMFGVEVMERATKTPDTTTPGRRAMQV